MVGLNEPVLPLKIDSPMLKIDGPVLKIDKSSAKHYNIFVIFWKKNKKNKSTIHAIE